MALRGSKSVWTKDISTSFHLTLVVCGSASGQVIPPLFLFPGDTLCEELADCDVVEGSFVTASNKGYMTELLFMHWLSYFSDSVGEGVERPILLVMDGCSSHVSDEIITKALTLKVLPPFFYLWMSYFIFRLYYSFFPPTRRISYNPSTLPCSLRSSALSKGASGSILSETVLDCDFLHRQLMISLLHIR